MYHLPASHAVVEIAAHSLNIPVSMSGPMQDPASRPRRFQSWAAKVARRWNCEGGHAGQWTSYRSRFVSRTAFIVIVIGPNQALGITQEPTAPQWVPLNNT